MLNPTPNPPFSATGRRLTSVLPRTIDLASGRTPNSRWSYSTLSLLHVIHYPSFRQGFFSSFSCNHVLFCIVTLPLVADLYPPLSNSLSSPLYFFRFLCVLWIMRDFWTLCLPTERRYIHSGFHHEDWLVTRESQSGFLCGVDMHRTRHRLSIYKLFLVH